MQLAQPEGPENFHYNFTPPEVLTWTTSPKGGKDWVLVSCLL